MDTHINGPAVLDSALWALEDKFWKGSSEFYDRHVSADAVMVFPGPVGLQPREKIVTSVRDAPRWSWVELHDPRIVRPADSVAILAYRAEAWRDGDAQPSETLASSTYTLSEGTWKLAFHQQTPVPPQLPNPVRNVAWRAAALGALAVGATALGALAVGRVALGVLRLRRGHIGRLEIDELAIGRLEVTDVDAKDGVLKLH